MKTEEKLRFESSSHSYWLGSRRLPSVTQILHEAGLCGDIDERVDMSVGTEVHRITAVWDKERKVDYDPVVYSGYFDAWIKFLREIPFLIDPEGIETPIADKEFGFAGTPDRTGLIDGKFGLIEIKTGPPKPWHHLQMAGYVKILHQKLKATAYTRIVYLGRNGTYRLGEKCSDKLSASTVFYSSLACANWRIKNNCFWSKEER